MTPHSAPPVSALVLTKNEERYIARCLTSLTWVDEIVVVDADSSDQTSSICLDPVQPWATKIHFHKQAWQGFRNQRTFAMNTAKNDWVLVVDADEQCSAELAIQIQNFFNNGTQPLLNAYKVKRVEYFLGKPIRHGIWNPSYQDRFFHRAGVRYVNEVHEYPIFPAPPGMIHAPLHHAPDFNPDRFLDKMNRYTTIEAQDRVRQGQRTNLIHLLGAFPAMFLKNYFYYGAYQDGWHGLVISLLEGISRVVRHIKIWQLTQKSVNQKFL